MLEALTEQLLNGHALSVIQAQQSASALASQAYTPESKAAFLGALGRLKAGLLIWLFVSVILLWTRTNKRG